MFIPMMPPRPQAAKYFPLYSSILGFGRAFSRVDMFDLKFVAQLVFVVFGVERSSYRD